MRCLNDGIMRRGRGDLERSGKMAGGVWLDGGEERCAARGRDLQMEKIKQIIKYIFLCGMGCKFFSSPFPSESLCERLYFSVVLLR